MIKVQRFQFYELVSTLVLLVLFGFLLFVWVREHSLVSCSNCTGNLKQLGNAAALYEGDNAGNRPGPQPLGQGISLVSWDRPLAIQIGASIKMTDPLAMLTLRPPHHALKTLTAFSCPADVLACWGARLVPAVPGSLADGTAPGAGICRSYSLNLGSGNQDGIVANASAISVKQVESGAGTVHLVENHGYATVFGQRNLTNDAIVACSRIGRVMPMDAFTNPAVPMHGVKAKPRFNALMYDGHVEVLEQASVTAGGGAVMQYLKDSVVEPPAKEVAK